MLLICLMSEVDFFGSCVSIALIRLVQAAADARLDLFAVVFLVSDLHHVICICSATLN